MYKTVMKWIKVEHYLWGFSSIGTKDKYRGPKRLLYHPGSCSSTLFENHQKCLIFEFFNNFCWIKLDHNLQVFKKSPNWPFLSFSNNSSNLNCLVTLFEHKLQVFKKSPKCVFFAFFNNFCSSFKYLLTLFDSKLFQKIAKFGIFGIFK